MRLWATLILFISIVNTGFATPEVTDYAKLPNISQMAISSSGERIAYRLVTNDKDVFVVRNVKDMSIVGGITNNEEVKPSYIRFVDDDKIILFSKTNLKLHRYRGRHDITSAAVYNLKNNKLHYLLKPGMGIHDSNLNLGRIVGISTDKSEVFMPVIMQMSRKLEDRKTVTSLVKASLKRFKKPKRFENGTIDTVDFFVDDKGKLLARERYSNESDTHSLDSYIDGKWKTIYQNKDSDLLYVNFAGISQDKKSIVMKKRNPDTGRWAYYGMSLETGKVSEVMFEKSDRDVKFLITDINRIVYGAEYSGFTSSYEFFDAELNTRVQNIINSFPGHNVSIVDFTANWDQIVLLVEGDATSGAYMLYNKGNLSPLASLRPDISPQFINKVRSYEYKARDGLTIPSLVTLPRAKAPNNLPAIVLPHGGPAAYDSKGFYYMAQFFATKGYAVIQPQFRGSVGFGPRLRSEGNGEWGMAMQDDLLDAVTDLANKGVVNPEKVCIVGTSYGGYAALAAAAFTPKEFKCAVSINGVSDVESMVKSDKQKYGRNHWVVSYWEKIISKGKFDYSHLEEISPINHIDDIEIPVLLIHGERDTIVDYEQSNKMYQALKDADKNAELIKLPKGDHYLQNENNRIMAMIAIEAFLEQYL